ncbi:Nitroreductase [Halolactibacillus halophilus]|uniref:NADH dehydrogenase n=1 Tax=Halolactibacillus halophilus TaxID=306540 RepID=A0A1I5Q5V5_9BACI|nr:nitroreductase family protein [Halolactibacillus halophilus]GEM01618.1 NADH dehydrogenase [Halolactibacillus halophilus]SFP41683.1 Nitroreductase [Halolactibacillus halophilus]
MTHNFVNNDFYNILDGRRSIRVYDETVKIPKEEMSAMIKEAAKAPSSVNMQPWRMVVVESDEAKATLKPLIRFNTRQNDTSSAMILIFGDLECYKYGEMIYDQAVSEGLMPKEVRDQQLETIVPLYESLPTNAMNDLVKVDSSLLAMQLMLVARAYGYDTNPIGGFEADQLAEAFDLDPKRYVPVTILSIGKAKESGYESVRLAPEVITEWK